MSQMDQQYRVKGPYQYGDGTFQMDVFVVQTSMIIGSGQTGIPANASMRFDNIEALESLAEALRHIVGQLRIQQAAAQQ